MTVFNEVNEKFFNPFCCKNREVYLACINALLERSRFVAELYEADARQVIILYLQNTQIALEAENIGDEISASRPVQDNAGAILRYFRSCGWLVQQEIGRSGDNLASVTAYCRKLIDAVNRIFSTDANGAITNHIFSMHEILKSALEKDSVRALRPYTNVLLPLWENKEDLKNELLILKESIREIMRAVLRMNDANSFGQFLIRDELLQRFFNDYFFIKKSGLIPVYIANIDKLLRRLHNSELYDKILQEYMELKQVKASDAMAHIEQQFSSLDIFINNEYELEMDYIDRKINTYYNLYSMRMTMVLSNNTNLEHTLNRLLLTLKDISDEGRSAVLQMLAQSHRLQSIGYIATKSFTRRRKRNPNMHNAALPAEAVSGEQMAKLKQEFLAQSSERYSMEKVAAYFEAKMQHKDWLSVEDCQVHTRDDAMMLAGCVIYSGSAGFPFGVEFGEGTVSTEVAAISRITIKRVKHE